MGPQQCAPLSRSWGEKDFSHLRAQTGRFAEALAATGVRVETLELPGADHLGASYASGEPDGDWVRASDDFIRRT
jgi:hypothetical protein